MLYTISLTTYRAASTLLAGSDQNITNFLTVQVPNLFAFNIDVLFAQKYQYYIVTENAFPKDNFPLIILFIEIPVNENGPLN